MHSHRWIDLKAEVSLAQLFESTKKINVIFRKQKIVRDPLFDEKVPVEKHISECCEEDRWQKVSLEQKWVQIFKKFEKRHRDSKFSKVDRIYFVFTWKSASVERIFSIMNNMWSDHRSKMLEQNVKALITNKIISNLSCCDFYDKVQSNKKLLKKLSTDRYDWANT